MFESYKKDNDLQGFWNNEVTAGNMIVVIDLY